MTVDDIHTARRNQLLHPRDLGSPFRRNLFAQLAFDVS